MKDAKQFFTDFAGSDLLRSRILEEMDRLRDGEDLEMWQAGQKAAFALGYDIPDEVYAHLKETAQKFPLRRFAGN